MTKAKADVKKRAAIYARVSTDQQDLEVQLRELRKLVEQREWVLAETYTDEISGAKNERPGLDRLRDDARDGKIDVVVVWALDRLGRSLRHLLALVAELEELKIDLTVYTQPIDTTTPAGRLTFAVLGAVAEFERELIALRVKAGLARRRAAGKPLGRTPRATQSQITKAKALREEGRSWRKVAMSVGLPVTTIRDALAPCGKPSSKNASETTVATHPEGGPQAPCA